MAYKKAGGAMTMYKKSLKKAQDGTTVKEGPLTEKDSQYLNDLYKAMKDREAYQTTTGLRPTPRGYTPYAQNTVKRKEEEIRSGKNFKRGGAKKALGGISNDPTKKEIRQGMRAINKADRQDKRWNRRDERIQARKQK
jgi:hypothetical protein